MLSPVQISRWCWYGCENNGPVPLGPARSAQGRETKLGERVHMQKRFMVTYPPPFVKCTCLLYRSQIHRRDAENAEEV